MTFSKYLMLASINAALCLFLIYLFDDRVWYTEYDKYEWYIKSGMIIMIVQIGTAYSLCQINKGGDIYKAKLCTDLI